MSNQWKGLGSELSRVVADLSAKSLDVYRADVLRVMSDAGLEEDLATGGYGRRQVFELVQNGADALIDDPGGRIEVVLTEEALYCANAGEPISEAGIRALMHAHISPKRGSEIGRFGLGFKSVLGVTRRPTFYSRPASFAFDADWAEAQIREIVGEQPQYPALRLARPVDPSVDAAADAVLASLMEWATTVVKLPRDRPAEWLGADLDAFPPEFLLFSSHVGVLHLRNDLSAVQRDIRMEVDEDLLQLEYGADMSIWKVFSSKVRPSAEAKDEAGKLAARDELPIEWAVPIEGRVETGRFWAFFPLRDETTLSGILNAPWQVNDDRTGLLETSKLNSELLDEMGDLVARSLPALHKTSDPGWVLGVLPGRGKEARSWGDGVLRDDATFEKFLAVPCVADGTGRLRQISELRIPPRLLGDPDREILEFWGAAPSLDADWCHPSTIWNTIRRSRVDRLLALGSEQSRTVTDWVESVVGSVPSVEDSRYAISLISRLVPEDGFDAQTLRDVRRARVLLVEGQYVPINSPDVFLPADGEIHIEDGRIADTRLAGSPESRTVLERLGLKAVTAESALGHALNRRGGSSDWGRIWEIVRLVAEPAAAVDILRKGGNGQRAILVRTVSGAWKPTCEVLLDGPVARSDRDPNVAVDVRFHDADMEILQGLGLGALPQAGFETIREPYVEDYRMVCYRDYVDDLQMGTKPQQAYMTFGRRHMVGPLTPLTLLGEEGRADFCEALLKLGELPNWILSHDTRPEYPEMEFYNPAVILMRDEGRLRTSNGIRPVAECVGAGFAKWKNILPVAELDDAQAKDLGVPVDLAALREEGAVDADRWDALCKELWNQTDHGALGAFYAAACEAKLPTPTRGLWCTRGMQDELRRAAEVTITADPRVFEALRDEGTPAILAPEPAAEDLLVDLWGLSRADGIRNEPVWVEAVPPVPLVDYLPILAEDFQDHGLSEYELVPCRQLAYERSSSQGTSSEDAEFIVDDAGKRILWRAKDDPTDLLTSLDDKYGFGLGPEEISHLALNRVAQDVKDKAAAVRRLTTHEDRLLELVGEAALRCRLPAGLVDAVSHRHGKVDARRVAELFLAAHGYDSLWELAQELADAGFGPPRRWAGSSQAHDFVQRLGFGEEYAGFRGSSRDPQVRVPGPSALPDEHDYQREIIDRLRDLLRGDEGHRRALLSLPTGAGKTRVAVQGLVEAIVDEALGSPIIWIAQSDELCEQAVQSWLEVWRRYGSISDELTISRFWSVNDVEHAPGGPQVIVATIDKLVNAIDTQEYEWLKESSCVVVDEAHGAIAPSYTKVLEALGISGRGHTKTRCPLIGLSATPFRGWSSEETERLVNRFGKNRLDDMSEDPYPRLQELGVLADVEGEVLDGTFISLNADEEAHFEQMKTAASSVYRRIATDTERNEQILSSIMDKPSDWPILLFAVSVEHAETMAALLRLEGIPSVAIDGETKAGLRRRYVEEFRDGKIRVLCNYDVLTQGFDAPAVRAIYVTRPVFTPNKYQQMIGRGLRGPANGGKDKCLIVNVADNWSRFGDKLAFRDFEPLWTQE